MDETISHSEIPGRARQAFAWRMMIIASVLFLIASAVSLWLNGPEGFSLFWPTNGLLLGFLLIAPKRRWPVLIALQAAISIVVHLYFYPSIFVSIFYSLANVIEVGVAVFPLRRLLPGRANLTHPRQLLPFIGMCLISPVISGLLMMSIGGIWDAHMRSISFFRAWWMGDSLGLFLMTPLVLMTIRAETLEHFQSRRIPATLLTLALAATPNFLLNSPQRIPLLFLDFPLLVFVTFRLGLFGAALGAMLMAIPLTHYALDASGMFGVNAFHEKTTRLFILQGYLMIQLAMVYLISLSLMRQKKLRDDLQKSEERYRNLADNSWDVILQMDASGRCSYVSPSIQEALSRKPEEMVGEMACTYVHPEDKERADEMMQALRNGTERQLIQIRMEHQDGGYRWMELKARAVRDEVGEEMREVVAIVRDVTARVMRDQELAAAVQRAENLALTDELTSLGNRRGFEEVLERIWNQTVEEGSVMAVLMIDADNFKTFNDMHGHLAGDECLRRLARLISQCIRRPSDYAARYGGEEFAVILPGADMHTAESIAERIRFSVANSEILRGSLQNQAVTVSIGVAQRVAASGHSPRELIRAADAALYDAKRAGRNCIRSRHG